MVNFGPLAADTGPVVWGTAANFNGFRVLAALLHRTPVVGVSQTLRRLTEGATYIWQGSHHVGHWPTFWLFQAFPYTAGKSTHTILQEDHPVIHIIQNKMSNTQSLQPCLTKPTDGATIDSSIQYIRYLCIRYVFDIHLYWPVSVFLLPPDLHITFRISGTGFLRVRCPNSYPTNNVKAKHQHKTLTKPVTSSSLHPHQIPNVRVSLSLCRLSAASTIQYSYMMHNKHNVYIN